MGTLSSERRAIALQLAPFGVVALLGFATIALPPSPDAVEMSAAVLVLFGIIATVLIFPWARPPHALSVMPPLAYLVVVALMRDAQGGAASGYAPLALLPVFWIALYGTWRQLALCTVGIGALFVVPLLKLGGTAYPLSEWRRAALWIAASALIGFTTQRLVTRSANDSRERATERDFIDAVLENAGALVIVFDRDARILRFNPAAERASGVRAQDALGRTLEDLGLLPPEDEAGVRGAFARLAAEEGPLPHENRWIARDGTQRTHVWMNSVLLDERGELMHVISTGIDMTGQRAAEEAARAEAERFGSVLRAATEYSIIGTTAEGTITVFNEGAERLLGYSAGEMIGRSPQPLHDPGEVAARAAELGLEPGFEVFVAAARADDSETRDWTYIRKDGGRVPVSLTVTAIRAPDGAPVGFIGIARDVTAQRRAEHALHESEALYRLLVRNLPDAIVSLYDRDLRGVIVGGQMFEGEGIDPEELVGRHLADSLSPDRFARLEPLFQSALAGESASLEYVSDRTGVVYDLQVAPYRDDSGAVVGAFSVGRDITARRRAERQLDAQSSVSRVLVENPTVEDALSRALAAVCDALDWQLGFAWAAGESGSELRCAAVHAAFGFEESAAALAAVPAVVGEGLAGRSWHSRRPVLMQNPEELARRLGGAAVPAIRFAVAVPILSVSGEMLGVAEFLGSDEAVPSSVVETLESIASQFVQYVERKRAEAAAAQVKEEFVANVSHELRTPLTAIDGWLQIILGDESGPLNDEQRRFLTIVKRNSDRLMRLVGDLLAASQIDAGQLSLELVDVAEVARETGDLLAGLAAEKLIDLTVDIETPNGDGDPVVYGDRSRLAQLVTNLLANAIKFTPREGSVAVRVSTRDQRCVLEISDTGIGIPLEERASLFSRFYRASTATDQGIIGTGLGLAISKTIVDEHHGTIGILDSDGPGTTFVVELPLAVRAEARR